MIDAAQVERRLRLIETTQEAALDIGSQEPMSRAAQIHELQRTTAATFDALRSHAAIADGHEACMIRMLARVEKLEQENRLLWSATMVSMISLLLTYLSTIY